MKRSEMIKKISEQLKKLTYYSPGTTDYGCLNVEVPRDYNEVTLKNDADALLKKLEEIGMYPPGSIELHQYPGYSEDVIEPKWDDENGDENA